MLKNYKNTRMQGNAGLGLAIAWFTYHGHTVSVPLTDSQDYDLVADYQGKLQKVFVRTATHKTQYGKYTCGLRSNGGRDGTYIKHFSPKTSDLIFILCGDNTMYLIPSVDIKNKSTINLCHKYSKYQVHLT